MTTSVASGAPTSVEHAAIRERLAQVRARLTGSS
jgi:hypothetical protein